MIVIFPVMLVCAAAIRLENASWPVAITSDVFAGTRRSTFFRFLAATRKRV